LEKRRAHRAELDKCCCGGKIRQLRLLNKTDGVAKYVGGGGQVREILMAKVEGIEGILLQNFLKFSDVDSLILHCYHSRFHRTVGV
jgi:hypothetical protein